ncbi:MAG: PAS domain-containing protein [Saprospiraceae bacterium]|nr:PAS domain-containing protein [Saprospiraceae bacterium]
MNSHEIEIILSRQWADYLSIPVFITDPKGNLIFYNEPAEEILGRRFEDTGPMPVSEWSTIFNPEDEHGAAIPPDDLPLVKTLGTQQPATGSFWIHSLEDERHFLTVTSFPIVGVSGYLGAIAIFWKNDPDEN